MAITSRTLAPKHGITWKKSLADNSGQSIEKVHADAERDNWMSAQETLEYGFIGEIMANNKIGLNHHYGKVRQG